MTRASIFILKFPSDKPSSIIAGVHARAILSDLGPPSSFKYSDPLF